MFSPFTRTLSSTTTMATRADQQHNCTEIVHEKGDAREITTMLNNRLFKGWVLDRVLDHMMPSNEFGGAPRPRLVIYYFKRA